MGKIFKNIYIITIKIIITYNKVKKTFKTLFKNEKSNERGTDLQS